MIGLGHALTLALSPMAGTAPFDPMNIAALSEWFDYRTLSGTGDGNPIDAWAGRKGLYTLSSNGTSRLTWSDNDGDGKAAISSDGVDDYFLANVNTATLFGSTGDFEIWCKMRISSAQAGSPAGWMVAGSGTSQIGIENLSSNFSVWMPNSTVAVTVDVNLLDDAWHLIRCSKHGARRVVQIDGNTVYDATASAGTFVAEDELMVLPGWFDQTLACSLRHWIAFNTPLDDATAASTTSYLMTA